VKRVVLARAKPWIKGHLKSPRPWKAEQVWVGGGDGGGKKIWRAKEDSL